MVQLPRPNDRRDFEIAIICALQCERDAVEAILEEDYETGGFSYGKAPGDHNAYTIGRIGNHHVVLAYMPGMGKVNSAAVASGIRASFLGIKLALLVGVCGGAPKTPDGVDIFFGDVIISTMVIQVDFGRRYPDRFARKTALEGNLGQITAEIRSFLAKASGRLARQRLRKKTLFYTKELYQKEFQHSTHPGIDNNILYQAHYRHRHQKPKHCETCDKCQSEEDAACEAALNASCKELCCSDEFSVSRTRSSRATDPSIHFGHVVCSDGVIKSGQHRDELVSHDNVIAFEMEGAGAWDHLPTVILKSVSDYSDPHKNKV